MLSRETVFRQIDADRVEPIQEPVVVRYDNALQSPVSFRYRNRQHQIVEVLGSFREWLPDPSMLDLVRAGQGVYALYLDLTTMKGQDLWQGRWVLHFKVEEEEEARVLVDAKLGLAAAFHGHLCPDLVIGYRASQCALDRLSLELLYGMPLRAIVENATSAVDAVQRLSGCTLGNARLLVRDHGKHVYTFVHGPNQGLRLALKPEALPQDECLPALESRIQAGEVTMAETARYQTLLDGRIAALLDAPEEAIFAVERVTVRWPEEPLTSGLIACDRCGDLVVQSHLIPRQGRRVCRACDEAEE